MQGSHHRRLRLVTVATLVLGGLGIASTARATLVEVPPSYAPSAGWSSDGDFATDTYGNPWDFADDADAVAVPGVGTNLPVPISRVATTANPSADGGGWLRASTSLASEIRFHFDMPVVLPWGRDGRSHPIDASVYRRLSMRLCTSGPVQSAIRWWNAAGVRGTIDVGTLSGCTDLALDLANPGSGGTYVAPELGPWSGQVTRLLFFQASAEARTIDVDYVRVHRADTPFGPPSTSAPRPVVLSPSAEGEGDWATEVRGNPWDFDDPSDAAVLTSLAGVSIAGGALNATSTTNDPSVELAVPTPIDGSTWNRLTVEMCMSGGFDLGSGPGGGTVGRFAWIPSESTPDPITGEPQWTETQDIVVFPGCHRMTFDARTNPPEAIHDEDSRTKPGWVCRSIQRFRWDPFEDPGARAFQLVDVRLGRDPTFTTSTPIRFRDDGGGSGATASVYVSTDPSAVGGTLVRTGVPVSPGVNTVTWDGTNALGAQMAPGRYYVQVRIAYPGGATTTVQAPSFVDYLAPGASGSGTFVPLSPVRLLDTRDAPVPVQGCRGPVAQQRQIDLDVLGRGGVPREGVSAVVLNVTGVSPTAGTFVTAWPSGEARPFTSNLNLTPGDVRPNLVTAKVGAGGRVSLYNNGGSTHLVVDVVGYFTTGPAQTRLVPINPERAFDTREAAWAPAVGPGQTRRFTVAGGPLTRVPAGVSAVAVNVTGIGPTESTYLTVFPGTSVPLASNLNLRPGQVTPNLVTVPVAPDGTIALYNFMGSVHVAGDVVGYFTTDPAVTSAFVPINPERAFDTRLGSYAPALAGGEVRSFVVSPSPLGRVPAGATGVAINTTAVQPTLGTYVTVWPTGEPRPFASNLNAVPGEIAPNLVFAKIGDGGRISVFNMQGSTHVVGDIVGYFVSVTT
jgi:hypothetical protein